jgi:hypothetical protein
MAASDATTTPAGAPPSGGAPSSTASSPAPKGVRMRLTGRVNRFVHRVEGAPDLLRDQYVTVPADKAGAVRDAAARTGVDIEEGS